jgi:AbrB family looped-hinge helix DNA binding protein
MKGMKDMQDRKPPSVEDCFYGTSTIGERGQVVIPAEARAALGMNPGDKVLIMRDPVKDGIMMFKIDAAKEFLEDLLKMINKAEQHMGEE